MADESGSAAPTHDCYVGIGVFYVVECATCGDVGRYKSRKDADRHAVEHEEAHDA